MLAMLRCSAGRPTLGHCRGIGPPRADGRSTAIDASRGPDWISVHRQDRPVPAADERARSAARGGQGGGERRRLAGARRAARSADGAVQPARSTCRRRSNSPTSRGVGGAQDRRGGAPRRRAVPQRRRAAARRPHVSRSGGAASGRLDRSRARRAHDGRRGHPRGPRRRRAAARTARARSEEGASNAELEEGAGDPRCAAAPRSKTGAPLRALELGRRRREAAARISVPVGQAAADRAEPRRSGSAAAPIDAVELAGLAGRSSSGAATRAVPICAKIELEIAQLDAADAARVHGGSRTAASPASIA